MDDDQTLDIVVQTTNHNLDPNRYPIRKRIDLADDLYIDILPTDLAQKIFEACEPKGYCYDPVLQFGQMYSFVRKNPPNENNLAWDEDRRLQLCIALSRLIQPTSISTEYAARIFLTSDGNLIQIVPGPVSGHSSQAFVVETNLNCLTEIDAQNLKQLIEAFEKKPLKDPLARAMWYHEYAARHYEIDLRWTLIATGIEVIVHTDRSKSTRQFVERVQKLSVVIGTGTITKDQAEEMYEFRSSLAHGQGVGGLTTQKMELYKKMEEILRLTIRKSILEASFQDLLSDKDQIRKIWPV
ncbi:MAG: hypothetical protein WC649_07990 [Desulfobacteria bacterium]